MNSPRFDARDQQAVLEEAARLAERYLPGWRELWPPDWRENRVAEDPALSLLHVFANLAVFLLDRYNEVPEKRRLAFYDFLGLAPLAPLPARTPVVFAPLPGVREELVPRRTEVTAGSGGALASVIFETEENVRIAPAKLEGACIVRGRADVFSDLSKLAPGAAEGEAFALLDDARPARPIPHELYAGLAPLLGSDAPGRTKLNALTLQERAFFHREVKHAPVFRTASLRLRGYRLEPAYFQNWFFLDAKGKRFDLPAAVVRREGPDLVASFGDFKLPPPGSLNGDLNLWLGVRPDRALASGAQAVLLPEIVEISAEVEHRQRGCSAAYLGSRPLKTEGAFPPFGKKPATGMEVELALNEALLWPDTTVRLEFQMAEQCPLQQMILRWEFRDDDGWNLLGRSSGEGRSFPENARWNFQDSTAAFTRSGVVLFRAPRVPLVKLHGRPGRWLKVTLEHGGYSAPGELPEIIMARRVFSLVPGTVIGTGQKKQILEAVARRPGGEAQVRPRYYPPRVAALHVRWNKANIALPNLNTLNNFAYRRLTLAQDEDAGFAPFVPPDGVAGDDTHLLLGFAAAASLPGSEIALLLTFNDLEVHPAGLPGQVDFTPRWSYFNGVDWRPLRLKRSPPPDTLYSRGGIVRFVLPAAAQPVELHIPSDSKKTPPAAKRYWIRLSAPAEQWRTLPVTRGFYPNAVMALHRTESLQQILGSGNERPEQRFVLPRRPVLGHPVIQVREQVAPDELERQSIAEQLARVHRIPPSVVEPVGPDSREVWVTWTEVPGLAASGPGARVYTLDRQSGEVAFGDGRHGRPPPSGWRNIRATYHSGGGRAGNVGAGSIAATRTRVDGVMSVTNPIEAAGGADQETNDALARRASSAVRHLDRAVTVQDFEQLAAGYSQLVERARCVMETDHILIAILPRHHARPGEGASPNHADGNLLEEIEDFIKRRTFFPLRRRVRVVAPRYVRVNVSARVRLAPGLRPDVMEKELAARMAAYLDPADGGPNGQGWDFGEEVGVARIAARLQSMREVVTILELDVRAQHARSGLDARRAIETPAPGRVEFVCEEGDPS